MSRKSPRSVLIIEARFYEDIADELARGAIEELEGRRIEYERIAVPGSLCADRCMRLFKLSCAIVITPLSPHPPSRRWAAASSSVITT